MFRHLFAEKSEKSVLFLFFDFCSILNNPFLSALTKVIQKIALHLAFDSVLTRKTFPQYKNQFISENKTKTLYFLHKNCSIHLNYAAKSSYDFNFVHLIRFSRVFLLSFGRGSIKVVASVYLSPSLKWFQFISFFVYSIISLAKITQFMCMPVITMFKLLIRKKQYFDVAYKSSNLVKQHRFQHCDGKTTSMPYVKREATSFTKVNQNFIDRLSKTFVLIAFYPHAFITRISNPQ